MKKKHRRVIFISYTVIYFIMFFYFTFFMVKHYHYLTKNLKISFIILDTSFAIIVIIFTCRILYLIKNKKF